jgi:hypothetical protein
LNVLSIKLPESDAEQNSPLARAFTKCDVSYRIDGDHITFDRIALVGNAFSLDGVGQMDFDGNMKLTFRPVPGRSDIELPVVRNIIGLTSGQVFQIRVDGTLADPQMHKDILPVANKAIQEMQSGVQTIDRPFTR